MESFDKYQELLCFLRGTFKDDAFLVLQKQDFIDDFEIFGKINKKYVSIKFFDDMKTLELLSFSNNFESISKSFSEYFEDDYFLSYDLLDRKNDEKVGGCIIWSNDKDKVISRLMDINNCYVGNYYASNFVFNNYDEYLKNNNYIYKVKNLVKRR